ncbi:MAG: excinuclease ABC subunit UvrA [Gammaproteobacteria bacterium]|jgi:excinuclease ABC subunit A|nr:excinuclease ABC subunit UvrA [Gammaproteobacteria bacterium]
MKPKTPASAERNPGSAIIIRGARQNNLKGLDLELPLESLTVVTGVSGSGKSSLAFDTVYAEGQRRYVETFSPYARQFLERMDKPRVDRIEGVLPAIAIDQVNPVRTSRSTVGTMTELNDHLKLLYARAARLYCHCGREVRRDDAESVCRQLSGIAPVDARLAITFPVALPASFTREEAVALLSRQGYTRVREREDGGLDVVQDRMRAGADRDRLVEALESAFERGQGRLCVDIESPAGNRQLHFSRGLHCPQCDTSWQDPVPNLFSFNSPIGACPECRGFGRVIGVDFDLVIPDPGKSIADGAIRPWQTSAYRECQQDLMRFARRRGIRTDIPWRELSDVEREWVIEGEGDREDDVWDDKVWYGARRFFAWLESRSYKMHIRVLLSRYRSYTSCPACKGARLRPEALQWRLPARPADRGSVHDSTSMRAPEDSFNFHELMTLPIERSQALFRKLELPAPLDQASEVLLGGIRSRLDYLLEVGLGYLTLDRQSRTLSGGEVQRINLTTALGTSLVNTLFVLDEPSIGLHARDVGRLIAVLKRLRDAGNTLLVVEHDAQIIRAADRVLELGPGPGEAGGSLVYQGTPAGMMKAPASLTGRYLRAPRSASPVAESTINPLAGPWLRITGACANNLQDLDVELPLQRLVCLTGVSGSGKSTLLRDVCYLALRKLKGHPDEPPGAHRELLGHEHIDEVLLVDQSPIGKTTRSNPASYTGALSAIRALFAAEPLARERGYTAGTFSFNSGNGRCPVCGGNGFEHVEMQFLSDVYLRCQACDGKRYRAEILDVRLIRDGVARSIADVLEMTVAQAADWFAAEAKVLQGLESLRAVGLDYLRLGQPVTTLSGGEAQRLKLAGHLARADAPRSGAQRMLFLLDEPTTGLHMADVERLLLALRSLMKHGHSVIAIEHNLDFIAAADWIVDLGPEGGDAGGRLICAGTPAQVAAHPASHTGAALRGDQAPAAKRPRSAGTPPDRAARRGKGDHIRILHAREHNLKNIEVDIPRHGVTAITGVSGSGKSTVAFDILFAEGQRRYLESLNAYARQFVQPASRPDVDAVLGIPPTVAIEQRTSRGGHKSTVGTLTEIHHFLRLLFVKLGVQHCPDCEVPIDAQSADEILARIMTDYGGRRIRLYAPLVTARKGYYTDLARWYAARGFEELRVDGEHLPTSPWPRLDRFREHDIALPCGEHAVEARLERQLRQAIDEALVYGKGVVHVIPSGRGARERIFSTLRACPCCGRSFPEPDPRLFSYNSRHGWCPACHGSGLEGVTGEDGEETDDGKDAGRICRGCQGRRLRPEALAVRFQGLSIADHAALTVAESEHMFSRLKLRGREAEIARDIVTELRARLSFLSRVGLSYLALDRGAPSLSGGEAQRIRLAAQLGSNLRGVCYILDEPTIGLHPRDNRMLLDTLEELATRDNTLLVVEHDEDTIRRANHIIDLGPGAGVNGGRVVAQGSLKAVMRNRESLTGRMLANPLRHPLMPRRPTDPTAGNALLLENIELNNVHGVDAAIPLGRLVCLTGVSGSGKSTLLRHVLHDNLQRLIAARRDRRRRPALHGCGSFSGWEAVERVLEVDQTPIGLTPRSCPATYVGFWDDIRRLYAGTTEARLRGYGPGRFSFNVAGGRCEACAGQGMQRIEMSFLPGVRVDCDVCGGSRFSAETLAVHYRGRSIGDVLAMSVDEATEFFAHHETIHRALRLLQDVGLGYLSLGQPSPTLSGGEAQRIKLVTELARVRAPVMAPGGRQRSRSGGERHALYVLDEPTVGLHMADVERLIRVLHRLVEGGATVVLIEHNLDVIAEADWVIDLGPEGGDGGGRIVVAGAPERVARSRRSHTGTALRTFLAERSTQAS